MKMLYTVEDIRNAVNDVLSDAKSTRFAIVAFVGRDPLRWLPTPKDLQVYCWPRAGGTNPDGIDALVNAGVTVHFKESLHSKVYHCESRGTVLGSANLSENALGTGRLIETAIRLPPGVFSVSQQMELLGGSVASGSQAFNDMMEKLRIEHVAYYQRNPDKKKSTRRRYGNGLITFGEWAELNENNRAPWQLGLWSGQYDPPQDVVEEFQEAGGKQFSNWRAHDCRYLTKTWGIQKKGAFWWYPEVYSPTKDTRWAENSNVWFANINVPSGVSVPFDCKEGRFLNALDEAIKEYADETEYLEGRVKGKFLRLLLDKYDREGDR
jgi:hypothetical protein